MHPRLAALRAKLISDKNLPYKENTLFEVTITNVICRENGKHRAFKTAIFKRQEVNAEMPVDCIFYSATGVFDSRIDCVTYRTF